MTCIVAIVEDGKIWMGCDSLRSHGYVVSTIGTKIIKKENIIMGFSGRIRDINLIKFGFEIPTKDEKIDDYEYMATVFTTAIRKRLKEYGAIKINRGEETGRASILIGYNNRIYIISYDFSATRVEDDNFFALGSGQELALGSLHSTLDTKYTPQKRLKLALSAAEKFISSVRGPFFIECLG